ncbi:Ubiquitin-protein ligase E3A [Tritrichomonas musculus]|uniref:HECT-type E3 ubiquitin transferase n=1 Tax=Tritrichomonas musculus TaxID=1915356 RepID=A0ABR2L9G0_9EUKA
MYSLAKKPSFIVVNKINNQKYSIQTLKPFQKSTDLNKHQIKSISRFSQFGYNHDISAVLLKNVQIFDQWAISNHQFNDCSETRNQIKQLMNLSFFSIILRSNTNKISCKNSALDDDILFNFFSALSFDINNQEFLKRIARAISQILLMKIDFEILQLRALFVLLYIPQLYEPSFSDIFRSIIKLVSKFSAPTRAALTTWFQSLPNLIFLLLNGCHASISFILSHIPKGKEWLTSVSPFTDVISILFEANKNCKRQLPLYSFQNIEIDSRINCRQISIFPFVLSFPSRLKIARYRVKSLQAASKMANTITGRDSFLELKIHRSNYYEEAKNQLIHKNTYDFLKKLKVNFVGEVAVDAGGPRRELLCLLVNRIIEKSLDLVNNSFFWFKSCDISDVFLLGIVIGLAISNEITLPIKFPTVFYSKLLIPNFKPTIKDFTEFDPIAANSLKKLYDMTLKNEDVSSLELTFDASIECGQTVPLLESMSGVMVTNENCKDFINEYINWVINRRYLEEFDALRKGFMMSCPQHYMKLITPSEFDKIISGREVYNWKELKNAAIYNDELTTESKRIQWFWDVFANDMDENMKKRFLRFTTGIDRPPFSGLKAIKIKFNDGGSSIKLPTSLTCFNMFFLPDYTSRDQLKEKVFLALQYAEGFGIM